jgi:hypothetical protein
VEHSWHVFPEHDSWSEVKQISDVVDSICNLTKNQTQIASFVIKRPAFASNRKRLTWRTSAQDVGRLDFSFVNEAR